MAHSPGKVYPKSRASLKQVPTMLTKVPRVVYGNVLERPLHT